MFRCGVCKLCLQNATNVQNDSCRDEGLLVTGVYYTVLRKFCAPVCVGVCVCCVVIMMMGVLVCVA